MLNGLRTFTKNVRVMIRVTKLNGELLDGVSK